MSGTSVDSIDVALVQFQDKNHQLKAFLSYPIPESLQRQLLKCNQQSEITLQHLCELQSRTGQLFAQATRALLELENLSAQEVKAIGSHGQTLFHAPDTGMSLQIGHPAIIAKQTEITTVADFRVDNMALGGQGAPFAPAFHQYLFAEDDINTIAVNIGGIANISIIPAKTGNRPLLGFDTGPGNGLMDEVCQTELGIPYDANGEIAAKGKIHQKLLDIMLADAYFLQSAPKSTGRDYFNGAWLNKHLLWLKENIATEHLMATLSELTAISVSQAITEYTPKTREPVNIWICGGGALNTHLINRIQHHLPRHKVQSSQTIGIGPNAIEAMLFAWLARQRLENQPINLKDVTGASRNAILGGVWLP